MRKKHIGIEAALYETKQLNSNQHLELKRKKDTTKFIRKLIFYFVSCLAGPSDNFYPSSRYETMFKLHVFW